MDDKTANYEILMFDNETFVEDETIRDPVTTLSILVIGMFLSLLIFFSIAGNILVCVAIYTERGLRRIGNLFLASLAIADLFVASLVMTFAGVNDLLGYWIFGAQFCDTWIAFDVMCSTASILNLCAISLDRYIHIKDPLRYGRWVTRRVAVATIATIWLLAALISFVPISLGLHRPPQPLVYHDEHGQHYPTCALDLTPSYAVISSCISFYVPCIVMIGIYCRLYCYAQKHVKNIRAITRPIEIPSDDASSNTTVNDTNMTNITKCKKSKKFYKKQKSYQKQNSRSPHQLHIHLHNHQSSPYHVSDHKAAITVGVIMGVFLICWVPFFCINIVAAFCKTCIPDITFKILTWLGYSNSAFNPIIYSIFNTEFREAFKRILTTHYPDWCGRICGYQTMVRNHHNHHHSTSTMPRHSIDMIKKQNNDRYVTDYGTKTMIVSTSLKRKTPTSSSYAIASAGGGGAVNYGGTLATCPGSGVGTGGVRQATTIVTTPCISPSTIVGVSTTATESTGGGASGGIISSSGGYNEGYNASREVIAGSYSSGIDKVINTPRSSSIESIGRHSLSRVNSTDFCSIAIQQQQQQLNTTTSNTTDGIYGGQNDQISAI